MAHAVVLQRICSFHVADAAEEQVASFYRDCWLRLIVVGQQLVVLQRIRSCCMMTMMMMMMLQPQTEVGHKILVV
jgi:hypothetical protein